MPINRKGRCKGTGAQGHEEFTGGQRFCVPSGLADLGRVGSWNRRRLEEEARARFGTLVTKHLRWGWSKLRLPHV